MRKKTVCIFQATNWQDYTREDLDISQKRKSQDYVLSI